MSGRVLVSLTRHPEGYFGSVYVQTADGPRRVARFVGGLRHVRRCLTKGFLRAARDSVLGLDHKAGKS